MPQLILYYPTIDIQDGAWLRSAVLYWDGISSIVPFEEYSSFSPEVEYLRSEGLYKPSFPEDLFSSGYEYEFVRTFENRLKKLESQRKRRSVGQKAHIHRRKVHAAALDNLIHEHKLSHHLKELLLGKGYIHEYGYDGWMEIDKGAADVYMRTLAEYTAKASASPMVIGTDKVEAQRELYQSDLPNQRDCCFTVKLLDALPRPSLDVSYEDLLHFKKSRKLELMAFKQQLDSFERNLSQCNSIAETSSVVDSFKNKWQISLVEMEKMAKDAKVRFSMGNLLTLVSTASPYALSAGALNALSVALLGGAAALGISVNYLDYRNKINTCSNNSGFSYLISGFKEGIME